MVLSWSDKISLNISGMEIQCHPPVGEIEVKVMRLLDFNLSQKAVAEARKELGAEASDSDIASLATKKINDMIGADSELIYRQAAARDAVIDLVVCGWRSVGGPEFKNPPSSVLPMVLKRKIVEWYENQFVTTVDEVKN